MSCSNTLESFTNTKGIPKSPGYCRRSPAEEDVLMRLDVQGASTLQRIVPQAVSIFLTPPSLDVLVTRLSKRATDSRQQIEHRLAIALAEMGCIESFDYCGSEPRRPIDETCDKSRQSLLPKMPQRCKRGAVVESILINAKPIAP